jgi:lysylphosphatidylglycerol synthetase-like protein (DUF2156 family)
VVRQPSTGSAPEPTPTIAVDRWWRGRFVVAAVVASAGLITAAAGATSTATVLLSVAVAAALVTLIATALLRHVTLALQVTAERVIASVVLVDVAMALVAVRVAPPLLARILAPVAVATLAAQLLLLARLDRDDARRLRLLLEQSRHAREPLGIVRARIDALRLALEDAPIEPQLRHDLELLEQETDAAQRALRGLAAEEPAARCGIAEPAPRLPPFRESGPEQPGETGGEEWPSESRPTPS